jgi:hypothetical protein
VPTTLVGLVVAITLLVPGFIHHTQRRARVQQRAASTLVETANLVTVSTLTNGLALALFAVLRAWQPDHTPDVARIFRDGSEYTADQISYLATWGAGLLLLSSALAFLLGARPEWLERFSARFAPTLVDSSAWYQVFEAVPDKRTYVGCDMRDGSYVGGFLDWYSTELEETADRDLVIAEPITYRPPENGDDREIQGFSRLVISARDIVRLYVSFVDDPATSGSGGEQVT